MATIGLLVRIPDKPVRRRRRAGTDPASSVGAIYDANAEAIFRRGLEAPEVPVAPDPETGPSAVQVVRSDTQVDGKPITAEVPRKRIRPRRKDRTRTDLLSSTGERYEYLPKDFPAQAEVIFKAGDEPPKRISRRRRQPANFQPMKKRGS